MPFINTIFGDHTNKTNEKLGTTIFLTIRHAFFLLHTLHTHTHHIGLTKN